MNAQEKCDWNVFGYGLCFWSMENLSFTPTLDISTYVEYDAGDEFNLSHIRKDNAKTIIPACTTVGCWDHAWDCIVLRTVGCWTCGTYRADGLTLSYRPKDVLLIKFLIASEISFIFLRTCQNTMYHRLLMNNSSWRIELEVFECDTLSYSHVSNNKQSQWKRTGRTQ